MTVAIQLCDFNCPPDIVIGMGATLKGFTDDPRVIINSQAELNAAESTMVLDDKTIIYMGDHYPTRLGIELIAHLKEERDRDKNVSHTELTEYWPKRLAKAEANNKNIFIRLLACAVLEARWFDSDPEFGVLSRALRHPYLFHSPESMLYHDFAPLSWGFVERAGKERDHCGCVGGIIFHGAHDRGGDGQMPTLAVCITPTVGWSMHT